MFEDPELQDQLPQNLNENYGEQTSSHQKPRKAPASSSCNCDPPEIQVIIKEEEEAWTVHENYEDFNPEGEEEETSRDTCLPSFKACRKKSSASHGVKTHLRICPEEKCPEDDQSLGEQNSTTTEGQQKHTVTSSNEKLSSLSAKATKKIHQHSKTGERMSHSPVPGTTSTQKRNKKSSFRACEEEECDVREQSTSSHAGEDLQETKTLALYQTDAAEHLMSHKPKMASENLNDRTLQLTVRLQAGEKEDEEEQDEEIGGLINSDGEVVEWDKEDASEQGSDCSEVSQPGMRVILSASRLQAQNQSSSRSPSLVMEVVSDEEEEEEEQKERTVKMTANKPLKFGKRPGRKKKVPVESLEKSVMRKDVPANAAKRRSKRQISQTPVLSGGNLEADPRVSRRSQRQRNIRTLAEPEELNSKTTRCVAAKRPYRRRKYTKAEEEGENTTGKKRPGRKMVRVPMEIPPELLKKPKEKIEYRCSVCGKEFPHAYKLERHELIHTGEKPYCCSICGRGFNQKGNLKTHYKVHLGRKSAADSEDDANASLSDLSEYLNSLPGESHVRSSFRCLECGMDCENQSALQAHHITTHSETPAEANAADQSTSEFLFCRWCGIQFDEKGKMEEHMKTHIKEKPYSCPDCGKRFINESYIQVHQRIHTGERPFLCSQCGKGFHTASSLKLHEMQHTGERPYACSICGKSFRINSYLNAHYQTHIKDRPFICSVCGKGYSRAEELKVHHRLHTGERPYECGECGKSFIYRQGLRQHQRTHAGRRIGPTRQLGRPKQQAKLDI